jgi:aminoglycoside 2'-N-acetyltransferase I
MPTNNGFDTTSTRRVVAGELASADLAQLMDLFAVCWPAESFTAHDLDHAVGGVHWVAEADGRIVGHASVVERMLEADGVPMRTGYVEAVATLPAWRGLGIATRLMESAGEHIRGGFELGALSTDVHRQYGRLGWERWRGPTFVRMTDGPVRTEDEDDGIMILRTPRTPALTLAEALSCEWRAGDVW